MDSESWHRGELLSQPEVLLAYFNENTRDRGGHFITSVKCWLELPICLQALEF